VAKPTKPTATTELTGIREPTLDRRRFLAGGAAGAGLAAFTLAGCSGKSSPTPAGSAGGPGGGPFTVLPNTFDFFSGISTRVAFALATASGDPIHPTGPVSVQIGPLNGTLGPPQPTVVHADGLANPYLLAFHQFDSPGTYTVRVSYLGKQSDLPIQVIRPSDTPIPLAGKPMISVATPTTANPGGVDPVCTAQPQCPLHTVSLDTALAQHHLIALQFATPALCQSRMCGPTLDNLVAVHQAFADKVTFIHCEIFTDLSGQNSTPPVTAYHLEHEPLLLLAGTDGIVRERIDNAFDRGEATDALTRLTTQS
jgi:hypothetical protein